MASGLTCSQQSDVHEKILPVLAMSLAASTSIHRMARRPLRRRRADQKRATEGRASIAIKKARAASRLHALIGEETNSSRYGHGFESPQLHQEVVPNRHDFPRRIGIPLTLRCPISSACHTNWRARSCPPGPEIAAAQRPIAEFARHDVTLEHSERDRSAIYADFLPLLTSGRARLLDSEVAWSAPQFGAANRASPDRLSGECA
jgi:hypothetical protein